MRLTDEQAQLIVAATHEVVGPAARVRLFGSRLRDELRGGDIDLLVESPQVLARPVWLMARLTARLQRVLGDRRIDVLLLDPDTPHEPVHRVALAEGVELG